MLGFSSSSYRPAWESELEHVEPQVILIKLAERALAGCVRHVTLINPVALIAAQAADVIGLLDFSVVQHNAAMVAYIADGGSCALCHAALCCFHGCYML
jgi:hypothetical protein